MIQRFAPDGEVLWRFDFADDDHCQHHDIEPLPNGNLLFIAWERQPAEAAIARGRDPGGVGQVGLWSDAVFEVRPTPPLGGDIVWSWHAWDHLVQDVDPEKPNYGALSDHPHRIDINGAFEAPDEMTEEEKQAEAERQADMAALGYGGGAADDGDSDDGPPASDWDESGDWTHTNSVDYHAELDLIVLSSPELNEIFAIDHSTTRDEAKGSTGGRYGHGGDLLWRWGNPANYGMGTDADKKLFYQHDPQWLGGADDLRVLVFNNGGRRPDGNYSSVLELALPFDADQGFLREPDQAFGPTTAVWAYSDPETLFSAFISGATRLPNGNTLVCSGAPGRIFELTPGREIVWDYSNDLGGDVKPPEHAGNAPPFALYRAQRYAPDPPGHRGARALSWSQLRSCRRLPAVTGRRDCKPAARRSTECMAARKRSAPKSRRTRSRFARPIRSASSRSARSSSARARSSSGSSERKPPTAVHDGGGRVEVAEDRQTARHGLERGHVVAVLERGVRGVNVEAARAESLLEVLPVGGRTRARPLADPLEGQSAGRPRRGGRRGGSSGVDRSGWRFERRVRVRRSPPDTR